MYQGYYIDSFIGTGSIDLHCQHTLSRSNYTHDGKCLHILPRSYLGVAAAKEEEAGVRGRAAAEEEEEAGVCDRAAVVEEEEASVCGRAAAVEEEEAGVRTQ
jgi:hypothetical protein